MGSKNVAKEMQRLSNNKKERKVGMQTFFYVRKSQICKFLGTMRCHKSEHVLGVPVRNSQIRNKFLWS